MGFRLFRALASKPCFKVVLCSSLAFGSGCGEGLKPFTVVDRLRIAAVATEPVRPQPGLPISVQVLTLRQADDDTPLTVLMSGCVLAGPTQACGPGSQPLSLLPNGQPEIETAGDNPTGARSDTWQGLWPQPGFGLGLVTVLVVNCSLPDGANPAALEPKLEELLDQGETAAPDGWTCAEDPLRLSRSVWIARHRIDPPQSEGEAIENLRAAVPVVRRTEDQAELEAGLVRTALSAEIEGLVPADEPRWSWFTTAPQGVVMRVSAAEHGETKALMASERSADYSYWVIVRDSAGRTDWNHLFVPKDLPIEP
jgi:hypothetical protein